MATARIRTEKLVPWYHRNKDRCEVLTIKGPQCVNSASYIATTGKNGSSEETAACKPHADILALDGWKVKLRKARRIRL
jgi:hypothetical protein